MAMDIAPEDQDKLAQLFGGKLGGNAADLFAAAAAKQGAGAPPPGPTASSNGIPGMPAAPPPAATPKASDDPAITGQPQQTSPMPGAAAPPVLPPAPNFLTPPVGQMQDLNKRIAAASQPVLRQDNQPHWWERLLAPVAAGITGYGNEQRGVDVGKGILDRRYNRAMENQQKTVSPLEAEFERQSKIEPTLRDTNENSQRTFTDQMDRVKETREQGTADSNAQYKSDLNDIRQNIAAGKLDEAKQALAETSERNRNNLEIQQQLLAVRQQLADARDRQVDKNKNSGATSAESRLIETNKQQALNKAEDEYSKDIDDLNQMRSSLSRGGKTPPDDSAERAAALHRLDQKKQRAQDSYEAEVQAAGGTVSKSGQPAASGSAPIATGAAPAGKFNLGADAQGNVPKAKVQEYATIHKLTYDQAAKGIQSKGYKIK